MSMPQSSTLQIELLDVMCSQEDEASQQPYSNVARDHVPIAATV